MKIDRRSDGPLDIKRNVWQLQTIHLPIKGKVYYYR